MWQLSTRRICIRDRQDWEQDFPVAPLIKALVPGDTYVTCESLQLSLTLS